MLLSLAVKIRRRISHCLYLSSSRLLDSAECVVTDEDEGKHVGLCGPPGEREARSGSQQYTSPVIPLLLPCPYTRSIISHCCRPPRAKEEGGMDRVLRRVLWSKSPPRGLDCTCCSSLPTQLPSLSVRLLLSLVVLGRSCRLSWKYFEGDRREVVVLKGEADAPLRIRAEGLRCPEVPTVADSAASLTSPTTISPSGMYFACRKGYQLVVSLTRLSFGDQSLPPSASTHLDRKRGMASTRRGTCTTRAHHAKRTNRTPPTQRT